MIIKSIDKIKINNYIMFKKNYNLIKKNKKYLVIKIGNDFYPNGYITIKINKYIDNTINLFDDGYKIKKIIKIK